MKRRLSARYEQWVEELIEQHRGKDDVTWDAAFNVTQEEGAVILVVFFLPGAILNTYVSTVIVAQNPVITTRDDLEQMVTHTIEQLRKARSEQAQMPAEGNSGQGLTVP